MGIVYKGWLDLKVGSHSGIIVAKPTKCLDDRKNFGHNLGLREKGDFCPRKSNPFIIIKAPFPISNGKLTF